jgi:hypothetical protein
LNSCFAWSIYCISLSDLAYKSNRELSIALFKSFRKLYLHDHL